MGSMGSIICCGSTDEKINNNEVEKVSNNESENINDNDNDNDNDNKKPLPIITYPVLKNSLFIERSFSNATLP